MRRDRVDILLAMLAALTLALGVGGRSMAAGPGAGSETGHVWLMLGDADGDGVSLVHAPPRHAGANAEPASSPGTLRLVRPLVFPPTGLAAVGSELVIATTPSAPAGDAGAESISSKVLSLRAAASRMGDFWVYEPQGRLRADAPLPSGLRVRSLSSDGEGVIALGELAGSWWLGRRSDAGWERLALPDDAASATELRLTPSVGGPVGLFSPSASGALWAWTRDGSDEGGGSWTRTRLSIRSALGVRDELFLVEREWFVTRPGAGGLAVASVDEEGERLRALIEQAPPTATVAVTADPDGRRLTVVWRTRTEQGLVSSDTIEIAEVSLVTMDTIYRGAPIHASPISPGAFRALAASLVALAAISLLIVLGPGERPIELPEGASLAEPGRRLIASVIDALLALWLASALFGVRIMEILTLGVIFRGDGSWASVPASLGVGLVVGVVGEWAFGGTPGKALTGIRVVDARPGVARRGRGRSRPSLWQCLVRNGVKWALPPVAALAMLDPTGRHRGDVLSRAAVVVAGESDGPASERGGDGADGSA